MKKLIFTPGIFLIDIQFVIQNPYTVGIFTSIIGGIITFVILRGIGGKKKDKN